MAESMHGLKRTHYCGEILPNIETTEVVVTGWAQKTRDLGNLVFIDLRDRSGIVQLAFDDTTAEELRQKAAGVRAEFVLAAKGVVRRRQSVNTEIPTGEVEVFVSELRILSEAKTPPFEITESDKVKEETRLKYRYLDLRNPTQQRFLAVRHKITKATRDYFDANGFYEIETPMLIKSTPEGARDYLVPSRLHKGKFYALPQSPQIYKQLLMLAGFDRYLQIVKCFRDEDLRADRQPEFTQIDLEMSFVEQDDVLAMNEGFVKHLFKTVIGLDVNLPLKRLPYAEAMEHYGSDKPDTRFGLELVDLSQEVAKTEFQVFAGALAAGGSVRAINVKGAAERFSRKEIDKLTELAKTYKAKGLAYTRMLAEGANSSFEKFLSEEEIKAIREKTGAETGDLILVVADGKNDVVFDALGALRKHLGEVLGLYDKKSYDLLWVTDFPLFEYSEEQDRFVSKHHPFTHPHPDDIQYMLSDPGRVRSIAYDLVINGYEAGGGSMRIYDKDLQSRMFEALGFTKEEADERFGFMLGAFEYGVPPHGGVAYGLDRLAMLLGGTENIKDVIAFPKVQNASDLMAGCPAEVLEKDLDVLHILVNEKE